MRPISLQFYRESFAHHGVPATLFYGAYRVANKVARVAVWNALTVSLEKVSPEILADVDRVQGRMLTAEQMRAYVGPENNLSHEGLDQAQGSRCFALFEGDELTSYGWYANRPIQLTEIDSRLTLQFSPSYVYMYNGFTLPRHRGKRLHAIGMTAALQTCVREGSKGIVSYVDATNFASIKSCHRMGYETFGHVALLSAGSRYWCHASPGCAAFGFRVEDSKADRKVSSANPGALGN